MGSDGPFQDDDRGVPVKVHVVDRRHHASHSTAEAPAGDRTSLPSFVEELKARTEAAEVRAREAVARAAAEIDAVRERLQRDVERRVSQGKAGLLASVLDLADNLERAAGAAAETSQIISEGINLIHQQLLAILKAQGVEPIQTLGLAYDPHLAEAVVLEAVEADRHNLVIEEVQRGYRYGETILRPARVKVGKAPSGPP